MEMPGQVITMKVAVFLSLAVLAALPGTAQSDELFNNGPVVDANGKSVRTAPAQSFALGMQSKSSNAVADDFSVGSGSNWRVSSLDFFGYQNGATAFTLQDVSWRILSGDVNNGTLVASGTTALVNAGLVGYRVAATAPADTTKRIFRASADIPDLTLASGHYWLSWHMTGSRTSGPWQAPTADARSGNAMNFQAGAAYATFVDEGSNKSVELPFVINGSLISAVPEPSTGLLMLAGGLALAQVLTFRRHA